MQDFFFLVRRMLARFFSRLEQLNFNQGAGSPNAWEKKEKVRKRVVDGAADVARRL